MKKNIIYSTYPIDTIFLLFVSVLTYQISIGSFDPINNHDHFLDLLLFCAILLVWTRYFTFSLLKLDHVLFVKFRPFFPFLVFRKFKYSEFQSYKKSFDGFHLKFNNEFLIIPRFLARVGADHNEKRQEFWEELPSLISELYSRRKNNLI